MVTLICFVNQVLGGGLGSAAGLYADSLVAAARAHIWAPAGRELPIVPAQLGPDAALVGAACTPHGDDHTALRAALPTRG